MISCNKKQDAILPEYRKLTVSVYASVTIQPDSLYEAYSSVAGILDHNLVEEGDLISKEKAIVQIINNTPKLNTQNAKLALDLARENYNGRSAILSGLQDEIISATLKYKNDSVNYFRQKKLWDQNIGSEVEYDTKQLEYKLSFNNLQLLKNNYERTENELITTLRQAENNYETAKISTEDFTVKSKINGKVYALYKEPGELVSTMEPLASIGSPDSFVIEMLVDEVDIVMIDKGQKVLIVLDAYGTAVFEASVIKILPKKDERNQTFIVEAVFDALPEKLYPGLSGEANIIVAVKDSVLTIPKTYLIDNNMVQTDAGLISVTIGSENMEFVEIRSGIDKATHIYKPAD